MNKRPTWFTWEKVPIDKHIWLWLYHNMDYKKKIIIFFLRNEWSFICKNLCTLHTRMLCAKFSWNCLKKKIFKCSQFIFAFSLLSPLRKRAWPFLWTNLNTFHQRMLCANFGWNWSRGAREKDINLKSSQLDKKMDGWTTDNVIRKTYLSFQLRWAKKYMCACNNQT